MFLKELVQSNFTTIIALLCFCIFILTNQTLDRRMTVIFVKVAAIASLLVAAAGVDYWCAQRNTPMLLRYFTSATGYSLRPVIIYITVKMLARKQEQYQLLFKGILLINGLLAYSSCMTKLVFYFDATNEFHRGPLGMMPFVVSGFFLYLLTVTTIRRFRMGKQRESLVIFMVAFINIICVVLESVYKLHFVLNGGIVISTVFYYLYLHVQTYKRDALTGVLNRHSFYIDSEKMSNQDMLIVSIDMNDLKQINDNLGHAKGDEAIKVVTDCIQKHLKAGSFLYRVGGDEFVVLLPKVSMDAGETIMQSILEELNGTEYSVAYGMAEYQPMWEFEKVYAISDGRMYDMKMQMKSR